MYVGPSILDDNTCQDKISSSTQESTNMSNSFSTSRSLPGTMNVIHLEENFAEIRHLVDQIGAIIPHFGWFDYCSGLIHFEVAVRVLP